MFWECHIIQAFWRNVTVFLQNKLSINTELSYKEISFCNDSYPNINEKYKSVSINFILLLAKYFIFKCKNRKETPCMLTLSGQALKGIFKMNKQLNKFTNLTVKHRIDLYDKLIYPILSYCSEVWGFVEGNTD